MAYFPKLWGLCRTSMAQTAATGGHAAELARLNPVPTTSRRKLFVGGLTSNVNDQFLKVAFSSFGEITDAKVVPDRETGRSKGFAFVEFSSEESAKAAVSRMDGQLLNGRNIHVSYATIANATQGFGGRSSSYRDMQSLASTFAVKSKLGLKMKR